MTNACLSPTMKATMFFMKVKAGQIEKVRITQHEDQDILDVKPLTTYDDDDYVDLVAISGGGSSRSSVVDDDSALYANYEPTNCEKNLTPKWIAAVGQRNQNAGKRS